MSIRPSDEAFAPAQGSESDRFRHIHIWSETESVVPAPHARSVRRPLAGVSRSPRPKDEPFEPETGQFFQRVLSCAGVEVGCYQKAPLMRRLGACLRALRARGIEEARQQLEQNPDCRSEAVSALLIGVTRFFREPSVFSHLDEMVLPKASAGRDGLRIWSAGCSDGAELYSVAMLLAERGLLDGSTLLGTDCRKDAIRQARRGWYDPVHLETLEERFRQTYFIPRQRGWQVCDVLKRATVWRQANVLAGPPDQGGAWDLILCRNLAIYLEPGAAARLWAILAASLRLGGVLVTGKAERPGQPSSLVHLAPCIFERQR